MNASLDIVIADLKERLHELYGQRLDRVIVYGSRARGDERLDSDLDVMIVLSGPLDYWQELQRTSRVTSEISLDYDVDVSRAFATPEELETPASTFYKEVRRDGVVA